ncbi:hypothetical protein BJY21_003856 [Kineosphaera limosa]|uniref:hypothetical protein n=1 Tax=Kineosphaera limosa TaxID=111564 RepID=UPI0015CED48C|nr:hypothetical protein [Kineosphaera limosa]NYE02672.1 hypothetical protein [Kineosphaera limosa]
MPELLQSQAAESRVHQSGYGPVAIGIFAFAAKKKTSKREVIVEIDGADGGHLLLTFPSKQEAAWKRIEITWNREANSQAVA